MRSVENETVNSELDPRLVEIEKKLGFSGIIADDLALSSQDTEQRLVLLENVSLDFLEEYEKSIVNNLWKALGLGVISFEEMVYIMDKRLPHLFYTVFLKENPIFDEKKDE